MRERVLALAGIPVTLLLLGEFLVFSPAEKRAKAAALVTEQQEAEVKGLSEALAVKPTTAPLPGADQLAKQRDDLMAQIEASRVVVNRVNQSLNWGSVVRATVIGTPGLTMTQLRTQPAELVFATTMLKPMPPPTPVKGAPPPKPGEMPAALMPILPADMANTSIYRHRAEVTVQGNFGTLLGYLQSLQATPGELHWDKLQLTVTEYPQANVLLSLHTLSVRPETPFN